MVCQFGEKYIDPALSSPVGISCILSITAILVRTWLRVDMWVPQMRGIDRESDQ